jgi:hypothetical protein
MDLMAVSNKGGSAWLAGIRIVRGDEAVVGIVTPAMIPSVADI